MSALFEIGKCASIHHFYRYARPLLLLSLPVIAGVWNLLAKLSGVDQDSYHFPSFLWGVFPFDFLTSYLA